MQSTSNIVSLHKTGRPEVAPTQSHSEQRTEVRQSCGERMFIQITQAGDKKLVGTTLSCQTVDASPHGIKFLVSEFVPIGCLLDLWVDDQSRPGKFFLSGDVRWTQKVGEHNTLVGVRLQEGLATDIESWKDLYAASATA